MCYRGFFWFLIGVIETLKHLNYPENSDVFSVCSRQQHMLCGQEKIRHKETHGQQVSKIQNTFNVQIPLFFTPLILFEFAGLDWTKCSEPPQSLKICLLFYIISATLKMKHFTTRCITLLHRADSRFTLCLQHVFPGLILKPTWY